jgi:hypothetical protein
MDCRGLWTPTHIIALAPAVYQGASEKPASYCASPGRRERPRPVAWNPLITTRARRLASTKGFLYFAPEAVARPRRLRAPAPR